MRLHAATEPKHQVEGGLLLNVVVTQGAAILELLAGKDESLLIWGGMPLTFSIVSE